MKVKATSQKSVNRTSLPKYKSEYGCVLKVILNYPRSSLGESIHTLHGPETKVKANSAILHIKIEGPKIPFLNTALIRL